MIATPLIPRRALLGGALAAAALPPDPALAQAPSGTLRVGMTLAAIPLSNGFPDQGGEGQRFLGITGFNALCEWDLTRSDRPAPLKPGLATRWDPDPGNPRRWWFTIREGVRFHDGKLLETEDVVFSFDRAFKRDAPWFDQRASAQAGTRLPTVAAYGQDGRRFWIETTYPDSTLPFGLTFLGIVHRAAWENAGRSWDRFMEKPVGTGPFRIESWSIRERCVMTRFAEHWDASRIPRCERLVLLPLPDANTRVAALRSGQVDWIEAPPPDALASLRAAGFQVITNQYPHNWTWHFSMLEGSPWRDLRVRQAANLAVDRTGMRTMLADTMLEATGLVTPDSPWYGSPSFKLAHDPAQARRLLAQAGFGPRNPLRTRVAISASGSGQMQPLPMNEFVQQNLREVGIEVEFEVVEWNALLVIRREGAPKAQQRGITAVNISYAAADPFSAFMRLLKGDMIPPLGGNFGHYSEADMDALMEQAFNAFDAEQRDAILAKVHTEVVDRALFLFVGHDLNPRAMSRRVRGFVQARSWSQDLTPVSLS
ncbi:ABC transporter substrate-binding protein [Paracraurococcus ruber]|uniref:ABC transporter substrate-binding protein n=1 Tax=Paracraurococcus ruber TaxID=77675 RepID=A0ABS1CZS3_9PROT|nr:ABC transporter substrate-binding protein [Paracraurococcus ruber]MBK1660044.1 ABC transporter substrate-binding protein [Paracraurococcus ruber]TDG30238.1 ABC transporter substrate-binding protein [Paracraurococcus ruber]